MLWLVHYITSTVKCIIRVQCVETRKTAKCVLKVLVLITGPIANCVNSSVLCQ